MEGVLPVILYLLSKRRQRYNVKKGDVLLDEFEFAILLSVAAITISSPLQSWPKPRSKLLMVNLAWLENFPCVKGHLCIFVLSYIYRWKGKTQ